MPCVVHVSLHWFKVVSLVEFALFDCPRIQCGSVCLHLVRLIEGLLALRQCHQLETALDELRGKLTETLLSTVKDDQKVTH